MQSAKHRAHRDRRSGGVSKMRPRKFASCIISVSASAAVLSVVAGVLAGPPAAAQFGGDGALWRHAAPPVEAPARRRRFRKSRVCRGPPESRSAAPIDRLFVLTVPKSAGLRGSSGAHSMSLVGYARGSITDGRQVLDRMPPPDARCAPSPALPLAPQVSGEEPLRRFSGHDFERDSPSRRVRASRRSAADTPATTVSAPRPLSRRADAVAGRQAAAPARRPAR